jgi:anti-sigma regulatory factor (Ser/Thr protein kinase)
VNPSRRPSSTLPPPPPGVDVTIESDPANIAAVRRAVEDLGRTAGLDERAVADLGLCVNEALANVIRHAYGGAAGRPIQIRAHWRDDALVVTIRDWGNGVNPASLPPKPYDPLEPGGLGLICLQKLLTEVAYVPQDNGMLLVMTQRRKSQSRPPHRPHGGDGGRNAPERGNE